MSRTTVHEDDTLLRWRLILGGGRADGLGLSLSGAAGAMDELLAQLYDGGTLQGEGRAGEEGERRGGREGSRPNVSRWLGDVRRYFPDRVVQVMQQDAVARVGLQHLLTEPDMLEMIEPDVHLVATLLSLKSVMPAEARDSARILVQRVVDELLKRLHNPMRQALRGAIDRAARNYRPRHNEIDWRRTIQANLKHYQPQYRTIIPERLVGYGRRRSSLHDVVLCLDESGSMATSVVYAGVFGAVLASVPALHTHLVAFDTAVVDLTAELDDPVALLFGVQLGGGTDIAQALGYCRTLVTRPQKTTLVLISDLYEGGDERQMLQRVHELVRSGVQVIVLLALNDQGAPSFHRAHAAELAGLGVPAFACTPDHFPELMAAALQRRDIGAWAARHGIALTAA
jgi:Mg-chelatase subunit ChlD